jgi:hypothetical protein
MREKRVENVVVDGQAPHGSLGERCKQEEEEDGKLQWI